MTSPIINGVPVPARQRPLYCGGKEPLFIAALAFSSGIITSNYVWRSPYAWLAALSLACIGGLGMWKRSPDLVYPLILVALFASGAFYLQAFDAAQKTAPDLLPFETGEGEVNITGHVIREGLVRDSPYGGRQESVDVESDHLATADHISNVHLGIRLTIYSRESDEAAAEQNGSEPALPVYTYGERLRVKAKLRMPRNYANPGARDLVGYLASQGIRLTGSARAANVEVLPGFDGSRFGRWRATARRSILAHIQALWPGERGAIMQAMLIGGRTFFGRDIKTDFQRTGTYHILVVSGINVGILAFAFFWALRQLPFGGAVATVLTILGSWGYVLIADLGSPIIRATCVLNVYLVTQLLFRGRAGLNSLGLAALGMLLVNPRTLFEASFQLTFLSVIAISGIAVPVLQRTVYPLHTGLRNLDSPNYDYSHPTRAAQFRSDLRLIRSQLARITGKAVATFLTIRTASVALAAAELVLASAIIQLVLTLPMAWYFHRVTALSLPANAFLIPIAGILLPTAVLSVALSYVSGSLAWIPAQISAYSLDLLTGTVRLFGNVRLSDLRIPTPSLVMSLIAAAAIGISLLTVRRRLLLMASGLAVLAAAAFALILSPPKPQLHPGVLEVTAIDVGQGDSLLIVTPDGKTLLVDAGGLGATSRSDFDVGEEVVAPYLWSRGIRRLDAVAISHAHSDHVGGMRSIIANFHPRVLWYGLESPTSDFAEVKETAKRFGTGTQAHHAGEEFVFGEVTVRVLNPQPGWEPRNPAQDDESLVLHLQYGLTSALLVGDSHHRVEKFLIDRNPRADLLKIGHHGSLTSSSPEFLAAVNPQFAVVSAGFYNPFRHPRPEVMERYAASQITTYRTDLAGAVSFFLDGKSVVARPALR